ncbi:MAG: DUF2064 domain-containing protein [Gemmatimonadaceae bacterium]|nr:DUF2064 domain-containing protein [Gemmatimonadaceae bacterium]
MQATEYEGTSERSRGHERTHRRAIESIALSEETAGARVTEAVRHRLANGSHRVVVTHAKMELPRELVEHAFEALRYSGLVCAPDDDGEIALIGMTQPHDDLLAAIPWGTGAALDGLLSAAREQHVSVMLLPPPGVERSGSQS